MVAGDERVKTHRVHQLRIHGALEEGVVQRAGDGIPCMDFQQILRASHRLEHGGLAGKPSQFGLGGYAVQGQLGGGKCVQLRMVVVDVRHIQLKRLEGGVVVSTASRQSCGGRDQQHGASHMSRATGDWVLHENHSLMNMP